MTPLIWSLVFMGFRIVAQAAGGHIRAKAALDDLQLFMMKLSEEGRDPTPIEMAQWTALTAQLDRDFQAKLDELRSMVAGSGPSA